MEKENKSFKALLIKGIKWSLEKQNKVFFDKKNIKKFKKIQKKATF